ncbi:MAG: MAPEG family protein [Gloeobacterales cyanobacterium]
MSFLPAQVLLYSIAAAALLIYFPYLFVVLGRFQVGYDMSAPRALFDKLPAYAQRATWAHQNSFEVFMFFAAAALMVYVTETGSSYTTNLALAFLAARLAYSLCYIVNIPLVRSLMWAGSMACIAGLMTASFSTLGA